MSVDEYSNLPFSSALSRIKQERNLSFSQMAKLTGLTGQYLNMLVNGKRGVPKPVNIEKIASGLGISPLYFMEYRFNKIREEFLQDSGFERETFLKIKEKISRYRTTDNPANFKSEKDEMNYYLSKVDKLAGILRSESGIKNLDTGSMSEKEKEELALLIKELVKKLQKL